MGDNSPQPSAGEGKETVAEMMQHLPAAKELDRSTLDRNQRQPKTKLQREFTSRTDVAVLAKNYETRLEEAVEFEAVTHRSNSVWKTVAMGVEAHGRLPLYYRLGEMVAYKGYITDVIVEPDPTSEKAEKFLDHVTEDDTFAESNDPLGKMAYIVRGGERIEEPFPQTELVKVTNDENIVEGYRYQPAHVYQRDGDFPDFP